MSFSPAKSAVIIRAHKKDDYYISSIKSLGGNMFQNALGMPNMEQNFRS